MECNKRDLVSKMQLFNLYKLQFYERHCSTRGFQFFISDNYFNTEWITERKRFLVAAVWSYLRWLIMLYAISMHQLLGTKWCLCMSKLCVQLFINLLEKWVQSSDRTGYWGHFLKYYIAVANERAKCTWKMRMIGCATTVTNIQTPKSLIDSNSRQWFICKLSSIFS